MSAELEHSFVTYVMIRDRSSAVLLAPVLFIKVRSWITSLSDFGQGSLVPLPNVKTGNFVLLSSNVGTQRAREKHTPYLSKINNVVVFFKKHLRVLAQFALDLCNIVCKCPSQGQVGSS